MRFFSRVLIFILMLQGEVDKVGRPVQKGEGLGGADSSDAGSVMGINAIKLIFFVFYILEVTKHSPNIVIMIRHVAP